MRTIENTNIAAILASENIGGIGAEGNATGLSDDLKLITPTSSLDISMAENGEVLLCLISFIK